MINTIIYISCTIFATEAFLAFASVVGEMVNTFSAILARTEFRAGTKWDFCLTEFPWVSPCTLALIWTDFIHTYIWEENILWCGILVLIFCVEFWELSQSTCDLSQAEKKIIVVTSWATDKMTTSTILSEIDVILCICSACNNIYFLLSLR